MVRCDLDGFLSQLHKLYERNKASGTVWVTMKRSALRRGPHAPSSAPPAPGDAGAARKRAPKPQPPIRDDECVCLVRATDGKRKISAEVGPAQLAKFKASYQLLLRAHAGEGLKKREKKGGGGGGGGGAAAAGGATAASKGKGAAAAAGAKASGGAAAAAGGGSAGGSGKGAAAAAAKKGGSGGGKK
jgi:signal recognition particle subunit SRP14